MKRWRVLIVSVVLVLFSVKSWAQQDAQFSQYMFNGMYLNPAYAGFKELLTINTFYRQQWSGFEGAPSTFTFSVDSPIAQDKMGVGLIFSSDQVGLTNEVSTYFIYSYRMKITEESSLAFGLGAGMYRFAIRAGNVIDDDPIYQAGSTSSLNPDLKFGVFYNTQTYYLGISLSNLLSPYLTRDVYESNLIPIKSTQLFLTGGIARPINENIVIKPSFLYKQDLTGTSTFDLNASVFLYNILWVGASYRSGLNFRGVDAGVPAYSANALIFLTEIFIKERLRLGYAYDLSLSSVSALTTGANEISLTYSFGKNFLKSENTNKDIRTTSTKKEDAKKEKELNKLLEEQEKEAEKMRKNGGMVTPRFF